MNTMDDLKAYVDGEVTPERRLEIEAAMEQDAKLRQEMEEMRVLSRLIGDCVVEPAVSGLQRTLTLLETRKPRPWFVRHAWVFAVAGVFLFASVLFPVFAQSKSAAKSEAGSEASMESKSTSSTVPSMAARAEGDRAKEYADPDSAQADPTLSAPAAGKAKTDFKQSNGSPEMDGAIKGQRVPADRPFSTVVDAPHVRMDEQSASAPLLIRIGDISLRVVSVETAQNAIKGYAKSAGGYVESSNRSMDEYNLPSANLTLRIPEKRFEDTMSRLRQVGEVKSETSSGEDVTAQVADTEARLKVKRAEEESYVTMLRAARKVGELLEIKDRLSSVREEIESAEATRKALKNQSKYSTITVSLTQTKMAGKPVAPASWFDEAWASAVERGSAFGRWLATVGMNLLIFSPIWIPIVVGFWWWGRRKLR